MINKVSLKKQEQKQKLRILGVEIFQNKTRIFRVIVVLLTERALVRSFQSIVQTRPDNRSLEHIQT